MRDVLKIVFPIFDHHPLPVLSSNMQRTSAKWQMYLLGCNKDTLTKSVTKTALFQYSKYTYSGGWCGVS